VWFGGMPARPTVAGTAGAITVDGTWIRQGLPAVPQRLTVAWEADPATREAWSEPISQR
jgi:hypothetical protein